MRNQHTGHFTKGETIWPIARVPAPDGTTLVRGDVTNGTTTKGTGYDRYVFDLSAGTRTATPGTAITALTVEGGDEEDVMEVAIVNDGYWKGGGSGYSFRDSLGVDIPAANLFGGHVYRVVYFLNTGSFGQIPLIFDMTCDGHEATVS